MGRACIVFKVLTSLGVWKVVVTTTTEKNGEQEFAEFDDWVEQASQRGMTF